MGVSLKVVLSGFVTLTVLVTALVAFLPLYLSGLDSVESAVDTVRAGIIDRCQDNVRAYFQQGTDLAAAVTRSTKYDFVDHQEAWRTKNRIDFVNFLFNILAENNGTFTTASFLSHAPAWNVRIDARDNTGNPGAQTVLMNTNGTYYSVSTYIHEKGDTSNTSLLLNQLAVNFPFPLSTIDDNEVTIMQTGQPGWDLPFFSYDDVGISVVAPLYSNGVPAAVLALAMLPRDINIFLSNIGLRKGGRAMVFDARTPEGTLVGNSWGQPGGVLTGISSRGTRSGLLMPLTNLTDALMNKVIATYGLSQIINGSVPFARTMGDSEDDRTYVDVIEVRDRYGLNLRVVVAMPLIDFLEDYYDSRGVVIGILVAAVVVLVAIAVLFGIMMTKPLRRLGDRMYLTASLQDSGEDDAESALSEIADMQEAYVAMKSELTRMKAYLPQSVLQQDDDDEDDEAGTSIAGSNSGTGSIRSSRRETHRSHEDSMSSSMRSSDVQSTRVVAMAGRGGLNLAGAAITKRVTVLAANAAGYHAKVSSSGAGLTAVQNRLAAKIVAAIRDQKGVVDFFQGDHFVATWNAVGNVSAQQKRAASAALAIKDAFGSENFEAKIGAATSNAVVGNMGCDEMKRFNVVGKCYSRAFSLMQLCAKHDGVHTLVDQLIWDEVGMEMYLQCADLMLGNDGKMVSTVWSLEGTKNLASNEWMYQLEEGESKDPFAAANKAVELALNGEDSAAKEQLAELDAAQANSNRAFKLAEEIIAAGGALAYVKKRD